MNTKRNSSLFSPSGSKTFRLHTPVSIFSIGVSLSLVVILVPR